MQGLKFNGVNTYVEVNENTDFNITNNDSLTVVYELGDYRYTSGDQLLFTKNTYTVGGFYTFIRDGRHIGGVHGDGSVLLVYGANDVKANDVLVYQYHNNKQYLFINGVKESEASVSINIGSTTDKMRLSTQNYPFKSIIKRTAIFKRFIPHSLIADGFDSILKYYNPDLYYDFRLGHAIDLSGNGNHGKVYNGEFISGDSKSGAYFYRGDSYISFNIAQSTEYTIVADINPIGMRTGTGDKPIISGSPVNLHANDSFSFGWGNMRDFYIFVTDIDGTPHSIYTYIDYNPGIYIAKIKQGRQEIWNGHIKLIDGSFTYNISGNTVQYFIPSGYSGIFKRLMIIPRFIEDTELLINFNHELPSASNYYDFTLGHALDISGNNNHGTPHNITFL